MAVSASGQYYNGPCFMFVCCEVVLLGLSAGMIEDTSRSGDKRAFVETELIE